MMQGCMSWELSGYRTSKHERYLGGVTEQLGSAARADVPCIEPWLTGGFCDGRPGTEGLVKNAGLELLSEETESRWKIRLMKGSDEQNLLANDSSIKREDYLDLFHAAEKCKVKTEKLGPDGAETSGSYLL